MEQAFLYDHPPLIVENTIHPGCLPGIYSFLSLKGGDSIGQSILKPAETSDAAILRLYNPTDQKLSTILEGLFPDAAVYHCSLAEEQGQPRKEGKNGYPLDLGAKKIGSFILENPSFPRGVFISIPSFSWAVLPKTENEATRTVPPPSVVWKDVQQERHRAARLWSKREKVLNLLKQYPPKQKISAQELPESSTRAQGVTSARTAGLMAKIETLNRTFLEAKLSALMLEETWRKNQGERPGGSSRMTELPEELRATAAELRLARIAKRTGDILYELAAKGSKTNNPTAEPGMKFST
ncbi:MAG: hypothetical protein LBC60_12535, partial [Spirochaetaceae bacterium]|jgi:hypothetical protein|nr:hypothetical protein [Spirochaetaceae bacterium]